MKLSLLALACASIAGAQTMPVPVRALTTLARSGEVFGAPLNVQGLPGGRVLVNDAKLHRLVILDSTMHVERVVFDSAQGRSDSYGTRPEPVLPYGDSALFVDAGSRALILITPDGVMGRTIAAPNDNALFLVAGNSQGTDAAGRLVFRGLALRDGPMAIEMVGFAPGGPISSMDSLPLIRGDLSSRAVDTVAALRNALARRVVTGPDADGTPAFTTWVNPMIAGDEWALLSDGSIAIVRGHDYHIDWILPDGTKRSTAKLPFDWKPLGDSGKLRVRDSAVAAAAIADSETAARIRAMSAGGGVGVARGGGGDPSAPSRMPRRRTAVVPIDSLPDFYPAVRPNAARGDRDGNLWILPSTSAQSVAGELVYDVVNRKGELAYRVRAPVGRSIAGFAPGGVVFLYSGDTKSGFRIERARVRSP